MYTKTVTDTVIDKVAAQLMNYNDCPWTLALFPEARELVFQTLT
jgi:hypothetical protein